MNLYELGNKILYELSGTRAKKITNHLSQYHRIQASKEFLHTIKIIQKELIETGDQNHKIHNYIADGSKKYSEWEVPISWDIKDGSLHLLKPINKILCQFSEVQESICTHSKLTDIKAEVVHVGKGKDEDFNSVDTKDKIVLTTASPRTMIEKLHENEAIGIIAYPSEQRAQGYLEMVQYVGLWPNAENVEKSTFGFSLSRKQALELIGYMEKGEKVLVKANIDAELYEGNMHVLSTFIKGTKKPEEEIIIIAHICHPAPSANDNASGSALLIEIYKTIKSLIDKGLIEKPERTIRFLWVPEFSGTIPWVLEGMKSQSFKPVMCINLDMVGEHPSLVGYPFTFNKTSISTPSFLNDLVISLMEVVKDNPLALEQSGWQFPWNVRIKPFAGGSDHLIFTDAPVRIPSVMFGHPDTFHHTNLDTIEKVDSTTLKRVGYLATVAVLASAYENDYTTEIQKICLKGYYERKGKLLEMIVAEKEIDESFDEEEKNVRAFLLKNILNSFLEYENNILNTIKRYFGNLDTEIEQILKKDFEGLNDLIKSYLKRFDYKSLNENTVVSLSKIPKRKWKGPFNGKIIYRMLDENELTKLSNLSEQQIKDIQKLSNNLRNNYGGFAFEITNLINDERTVKDLILYLCMIEWKIPFIQGLLGFLELLKESDLIEY